MLVVPAHPLSLSLSLSLSLNQLLLYKESNLIFIENNALRKGGGIYSEYVTTNFFIHVALNRGCFIQYHSSTDDSPNTWVNIFNVCLYHKAIVTLLFTFRILGLVL